MPSLKLWRQERYCRELHRLTWEAAESASPIQMRVAAAKAAGYEGTDKTLDANARRLETRPEIKARLAELAEHSAELACLDASYALVTLKQLVEANLFDYMDTDGNLQLKKVTRKQMARIAEMTVERGVPKTIGRGKKRKTVEVGGKVKIRLHSKIEAINAMARIAGWGRSQEDDATRIMAETLKHLVQKSYEPAIQARVVKQIEAMK